LKKEKKRPSVDSEDDASVITGDPEFKKMEKEVKVEWI
jgi:hypothetical protein